MKAGSDKKRKPRRSRHPKAKSKSKSDSPTKTVRLTYKDPAARRVCLAGTFNEWQPEQSQMAPQGNGTWTTELKLKPGIYEYRLVVDGLWLPDPKADHAKLNAYGERNSLLTVSNKSNDESPP